MGVLDISANRISFTGLWDPGVSNIKRHCDTSDSWLTCHNTLEPLHLLHYYKDCKTLFPMFRQGCATTCKSQWLSCCWQKDNHQNTAVLEHGSYTREECVSGVVQHDESSLTTPHFCSWATTKNNWEQMVSSSDCCSVQWIMGDPDTCRRAYWHRGTKALSVSWPTSPGWWARLRAIQKSPYR